MKRGVRKLTVLLAVVLALFAAGVPVYASDPLTNHIEGWPYMDDIHEDSACVIDADSGAVIYSLDRDTRRFPASITKILTCLLVIENTSMDETVTIGDDAMVVAIAGNSNVNPVLGEQFSVEDCLYMLMLKSANDIAAQLAVHVGGSVENFAKMMNDRAAAIGCTGTHFTNPSGLPDEDHYTTAYDMALIMKECLKNETFRKLIATKTWTVPATNMTSESRTYENHNQLIMDGEFYYEPCIGGKTGYTDAAQRTLIAAAERDGRTLIAVTMHGPDRSDFTDMKALFEYGFNNFSVTEITEDPAGAEAEGSVTLPSGIGTDTLTTEEVTGDDGTVVTRYYYQVIPVGEAVRTGMTAEERAAEEARIAEEKEKAEAEAAKATADAEKAQVRSNRKAKFLRVLKIFLIILAILCAGFFVLTLIARNQRKKRRRRRAMQRRRSAGSSGSGTRSGSGARSSSGSSRSSSGSGSRSGSGRSGSASGRSGTRSGSGSSRTPGGRPSGGGSSGRSRR